MVYPPPQLPERKRSAIDALLAAGAATTVLDVKGAGPGAALGRLKDLTSRGEICMKSWVEQARVAAIIGSCPLSQASCRSGWYHFVRSQFDFFLVFSDL